MITSCIKFIRLIDPQQKPQYLITHFLLHIHFSQHSYHGWVFVISSDLNILEIQNLNTVNLQGRDNLLRKDKGSVLEVSRFVRRFQKCSWMINAIRVSSTGTTASTLQLPPITALKYPNFRIKATPIFCLGIVVNFLPWYHFLHIILAMVADDQYPAILSILVNRLFLSVL